MKRIFGSECCGKITISDIHVHVHSLSVLSYDISLLLVLFIHKIKALLNSVYSTITNFYFVLPLLSLVLADGYGWFVLTPGTASYTVQ